jgi:hypothetical protein
MRKITIVALHHRFQWKDTDAGDLGSLLTKMLEGDRSIELIAEEANKLPTTVGQRVAFRFDKPWVNVDMDEMERMRKGIYDELQTRDGGPLDDDCDGHKEYYMPNADGIREDFWLSRINGYRLDRIVFLCGFLHLSTVASKFRDRRWIVEEINVCEHRWYIERFGTLTIVEGNGRRWCECRPNSKHVRHTAAAREPKEADAFPDESSA